MKNNILTGPMRRRLIAIRDKVVVRLDSFAETLPGGVIVHPWQRTMETGEVTSAGSECEHVRVGDRVMVKPKMGTHLKLDGHDIIVTPEIHIAGVLE